MNFVKAVELIACKLSKKQGKWIGWAPYVPKNCFNCNVCPPPTPEQKQNMSCFLPTPPPPQKGTPSYA